MARTSRILAVILLFTTAAALPGVHAFALSNAQPVQSHPAGCHSDKPTTPAPTPTPVSYQCCVGAHHSAIPNGAFSSQPPVTQSFAANTDEGVCSRITFHFLAQVIPSNSPPGATPLRI